jgi:hypothetical protein
VSRERFLSRILGCFVFGTQKVFTDVLPPLEVCSRRTSVGSEARPRC